MINADEGRVHSRSGDDPKIEWLKRVQSKMGRYLISCVCVLVMHFVVEGMMYDVKET